MPLLPGEVQLTNIYADCHYYFGPPNSKPAHHRFDKRSYVYLYHDALNRRGRIEVANHAGTPDQDAFNGYFDTADIEYSYKQPTLFTITVQAHITGASPAASPQQDLSTWHLPAYDLRHEAKYLYKIHTLELYLWTTADADLFLDSLKRVLNPGQLRILDANLSHPEHRDSMSPVVQQLEKAAITPQPFQGAGPAQRNNSVSTTHTTNSGPQPPITAQTPVSPPSSPPNDLQQANFTPMAYNPAAPAKPEPIAHREKTPPPPDAEAGIGLNAAAVHEHPTAALQQQQYMNPLQQQFSPQVTGAPYTGVPGPGIQRANTIGQIPGPPTGQSPQGFVPQFAGPPTVALNSPPPPPPTDPNAQFMPQQHVQQQPSPVPGLARQSTLPSFAQNPQQAQQQGHPGFTPSPLQQTPSFGPGAIPANGPASPGLYPGHQLPGAPSPYGQHQHQQPGQPQQLNNHGYGPMGHGVNHTMHNQMYIPEGGGQQPAQAGPGQAAATGAFEQRMGKLEKGVSRFLKRLDK